MRDHQRDWTDMGKIDWKKNPEEMKPEREITRREYPRLVLE